MSFLALTGLLNFLGCSFFGIFVLLKNPRSPQNRQAFYISASIALYSMGYMFWQMGNSAQEAMPWFKLLFTGIIVINVTFIHYVFNLIERFEQKKKELVYYYAINGLFFILNLGGYIYTGLEFRDGLGFWPIPSPLFHLYLAFWVWQCVYGFMLLIGGLGRTTGTRREQIKYTVASGIIGFIGGASNWPMWYGAHFPPYGNILIFTYVILIGYAIVRYRLMDIRVVLTRTGIFLFIYALVLGVPFIIGLRTDFGLPSFVLLFILATLGPVLYRYLQRKAENMLMAQQREYQRILHDSLIIILREHDLDRLMKIIMYGMRKVIKVEYAAIFLDDREEPFYKLKLANTYRIFARDERISNDDPLISLIKGFKRPVVRGEFAHLLLDHEKQNIQLIVPSFIENRLLGFLVLGAKNNRSIYTREDMQTFDILSHQTALAIENCYILEERKQTIERLFHADKLAMVGGMAEGLAHQMKNRINNFSLASKMMQMEIGDFMGQQRELLERNPALGALFNSLAEIGDTIIDNVKRTNDVIQGVLNFTVSESGSNYFSDIPILEIANEAVKLTRIKHGIEEIPISVEIDPGDTIFGVMGQVIESLYSLIDNSYEAIEEKISRHKSSEDIKNFEPSIVIKLTQDPDSSLIEIRDNGIGISDADKKKILAPYYTTKPSYQFKTGSGLGLHIVQRMVEENHKGKIWFESEFMKGTSFYIRLPRTSQAGAAS